MRFAYIDSQGKEVSIPSTDALRLRIELGAIVDSTMFFDASTDKWADASDHEIYRTLKREIDGDDGSAFIAPPPPTLGMAAPDQPSEEVVVDLSALEPDPPQAAAEAPVESSAEKPSDFSNFGDLTLDDGLGTAADEAATAAESMAPDEPADPMDFDLGGLSVMDDDDDEDDDNVNGDVDDEDDEAEAAGEESGFDMGGFGDLLLAEDEPAAKEEPASWDVAADAAGAIPGADFGQDEVPAAEDSSAGFEGGLEVDSFDASAADDESPSWLADDSPQAAATAPGTAYADTSSASDAGPVDEDGLPARPAQSETEEAPSRPRRTPPPQRKLTPAGSGAGKLFGFIALLGVAGVVGWFGYQTFMVGGSADEESAIVLPEIPANLEPQLRQLAARANLYMVSAMQSLPERAAIPDQPPQDWLLGVYLANASRYPQVVDYWESYQALLREVRARDDQFFEEGFAGELTAANLTGTNEGLLETRAMAGFEAALRDRQLVYSQLQQVITAALDLHRFLIDNETDISYEPAAGGLSRDPVLEAVPVTEALGRSMLNRMAAISGALDELGFVDQIATEPVLAVFFEKLQATAIR